MENIAYSVQNFRTCTNLNTTVLLLTCGCMATLRGAVDGGAPTATGPRGRAM